MTFWTLGTRTLDLSSRTHVMGILKVTPDSFSDGGKFLDPDAAVGQARTMIDEGADIVDIGGESTRPRGNAYGTGAEPVSADEELARVLPVITGIRRESDVPISVDTYKSVVAREALAAGANIINDISGFRLDPDLPRVIGDSGGAAVVMHMRGTPQTMQQDTHYDDLFGEIGAFLRDAIERGRSAGIERIMADPGIGFGKSGRDNLRLLNGLTQFSSLGVPLMVGPSRKSFIGHVLDLPVADRLEGSLAAVAVSVMRGAAVVRVHDVKAAVRVARMTDAMKRAEA